MKRIIYFAFSLCLCVSAFAQDIPAAATKAEADSAYMKNDFETAIRLYESMLEQGESADIYYNLGNSFYKTGNIARAILNYERALLLNPADDDTRANLEMARSKTVDKVEEVHEVFYISWIKSLINTAGADTWAKWAIAFFLLFLLAAYFFIFSQKSLIKKIGFISGIVLLAFVFAANSFASYQKNVLINRNTAIVVNPSVTVRSTPDENGTSLFILHEGRKVSIKDNSMKAWKEISLEDGKVGWVEVTDIEVI